MLVNMKITTRTYDLERLTTIGATKQIYGSQENRIFNIGFYVDDKHVPAIRLHFSIEWQILC